MKILVTGAGGLIGGYLKEIMPEAIFVTSKDYNLLSRKETETMMCQEKPDRVIHLAAKVGGIMDNERFPCSYYEDNILMNTNILMASRAHGVRYFTGVISTCAYPDVVASYPVKEADLHSGPPSFYNFGYAIAKRAMTTHIESCNKQYGTKYNYVIPCNLYGFYDKYDLNRSHYVGALIRKIYNSTDKIELLGTGKPLRQFMYAGDAAQIIKKMSDRNITDSFNIATPEVHSIEEIARIAIKASGKEVEVLFNNKYPDGQFRKDADITKLLELFPDFEFTSLAEGLEKTYEHFAIRNNG